MAKYYSDDQIRAMQLKAEEKANHQITVDRYKNVYRLGFEQAQLRQPSLNVTDDQAVVKLSLSQLSLLNEAESQLKIDSEDDLDFNQHYRDLMDQINQQIQSEHEHFDD